MSKAGFCRKRSGFCRLCTRDLLAPSPGEFCTLSSTLTRNKMETRLFKGSRTGGCFKKPRSSVNVNGTRTGMQAHTKLFSLIEAEGTERETRNKSGRRANGSGKTPADLPHLLRHKVVRGGLTQADVGGGIHGSSFNQRSWVKERITPDPKGGSGWSMGDSGGNAAMAAGMSSGGRGLSPEQEAQA